MYNFAGVVEEGGTDIAAGPNDATSHFSLH